jgi:YD repeat-containing protein
VWISTGGAVSSTATTLTTYDDAGDKQYVTNALGAGFTDTNHTTETDCDKLGRTIEVIQPALAAGQSRPTTSYAFDANGNVWTVTDPRGFETVYSYDETNRKTVWWSKDL